MSLARAQPGRFRRRQREAVPDTTPDEGAPAFEKSYSRRASAGFGRRAPGRNLLRQRDPVGLGTQIAFERHYKMPPLAVGDSSISVRLWGARVQGKIQARLSSR